MTMCAEQTYMKEIKFKHVVKRSHSGACSLKQCTLPNGFQRSCFMLRGVRKKV